MRLYSLKLVAFFGGCIACYLFQKAGMHAVMASALTGLLGSFIHFPRLYERSGLHAAIYAGSFAGMCSEKLLQHPGHAFLVSLFGTGIYLLMKPRFTGFGGKLGAISFVASVLLLLVKSVW